MPPKEPEKVPSHTNSIAGMDPLEEFVCRGGDIAGGPADDPRGVGRKATAAICRRDFPDAHVPRLHGETKVVQGRGGEARR